MTVYDSEIKTTEQKQRLLTHDTFAYLFRHEKQIFHMLKCEMVLDLLSKLRN